MRSSRNRSEEGLAHALTVVRRRTKEGGQFILAVGPPKGDGKIEIRGGTDGGRPAMVGSIYKF